MLRLEISVFTVRRYSVLGMMVSYLTFGGY